MNTIVRRLKNASLPCFDAGSLYCPCMLATLGQCVSCSLLRGETTCDCGWSGLCIYQEFIRNGKIPKGQRPTINVKVKRRSDLFLLQGRDTPGVFILDIQFPKEIARWCIFPGSFVLLRPKGTQERFNVPISVMNAGHDGIITVAIEVQGPKTIALERSCYEGKEITAVAPFWSGLQGFSHLKRLASGKILVIAKGMGQSLVPQVARYVIHRGGLLKILLGPGDLGRIFIEDILEKLGLKTQILPKENDHNIGRFRKELAEHRYDLLISAGSDKQHRSLFAVLRQLEAESLDVPKYVWSSNLTMTCAEGICGSCLVSGYRGCKAQLFPDCYMNAMT